jgi:histidinol-phosphate aminotransferase
MAPQLVRSTVRAMDGYTPGEQPAEGSRIVKLNTNENPFPPSPKVMQAIREIEPELLRRYPNPTADAFRDAAARLLGVARGNLLAGNGSDDILTVVTRTFLPPGGLIASPAPSYSLYPVLAQLQDARFEAVPWADDWALPIDGLLATKADAIYVANPNAPSGTFVPPKQIAELAGRFKGLVLIDEAYADFAEDNCVSLVTELANVVVSRTLSKAYSLAGLRFGYAVGPEALVEQMMKVKDSYNTDAVSIAAATAAIGDQEYARFTWDHVRSERARMTDELTTLGWAVLPSQANFLLATAPDGRGKEAYIGLKSQGILVRYFDKPGLSDKIRLTIGTSQENNALLGGLKSLTAAEQAA